MAALAGEGLLVPVETSAKGVQALKAVQEVSRDYQKTLRSLRFLPADAPPFVRLLVPTKFDPRTQQDKRARGLLEEMAEVAALGPALAYRPAPYKEAIDRGLPVQAVGDERLREEYRLLGDAFLQVVGVRNAEVEEVL
ncbi:ParA family protein [Thermus brockianus]|uniref:ParA family protein n=1 Tax=Thermus brockianus TaxID=56956 RepID=A0ABM7XMV5_THEBO|nr:hypothetical protein [Thermus brockianus]BDG17694.1 hypothetical protein TbrSNM41_24280 [Thermus brockianus]